MFEKFNKKPNRRNTNCYKWDLQAPDNRLPFGVADSDYPTVPCIIKAIQRRAENGYFGYSIIGNQYKEAIKTWYIKSHNTSIETDWIVPVTGVLKAVEVILKVISQPGDKVIIQTPVYGCFFQLLSGMNRSIVENKLINDDEHYSMDYNDLEEKFKQGNKILLLCSPHNPIGRVWTKDELKKVAELAIKYDVTVISDEIHADIIMESNSFVSMLNFKELYKHLFVTSAPSKTFNMAGLHSSYLICPNKEIKDKCQAYTSAIYMAGVNCLAEEATIAAYTEEEAYEWMLTQNLFIKSNYEMLVDYLAQHLPRAKVPPLQGTFLVWVNLEYLKLNSAEIYNLLYSAGIAISKGKDYGSEYDGYIRFNIACPQQQLLTGLKVFCQSLNSIK